LDNNVSLLNPASGNDHEHAEQSADLLNDPFTLDEVIRSIAQIPVGKSAGIDGIHAELIKTTIHDITPILLPLFNQILQTGSISTSWGSSVITPVHKSGPTSDPSNYRGISITNTMYKIFTGIINKRLYDWAEDNHKIDESQCGIQIGYSVVDNIFCL